MKVAEVIAEILKREGVKVLFAYPGNAIIEAAAKADIRTVIPRQERPGINMADGYSRISAGRPIGVFAMQSGPGAENSFGAVAQAYGDSVPILLLPKGYPRKSANTPPNFSSYANYRHITRWIEQLNDPVSVADAMRRAFTCLRNGRRGPVLLEIPEDVLSYEILPDAIDYIQTICTRTAPDPQAVVEVARVLVEAKRPVIYAGQGVHYARAWQQLKELAELLGAPVSTSLQGKSAFPEDHQLSLGSAGRSVPGAVQQFIGNADVIFGIGCSFTATAFGISIPTGKVIIHATLDFADLNKDVRADYALIGDAKLTLEALISELREILKTTKKERNWKTPKEIEAVKGRWMAQWMPKLESNEIPLSPYRVLWDLMHTVDRANTIITHDSGSPRDQLSPFWETVAPLTYIGWGKSTQLGYSMGATMGAKLAEPNKLCINVMGDAAIGFTGMDFETAVRQNIPILTIVLNNFCMAIELPNYKVATEKFRCTDISGNYADMAKALGGYSERVTKPSEIVAAIKRAIEKTRAGTPAMLEFITAKETQFSVFR